MRRRNLLALPALGWAAGMARASGETLSPPRTPGIPVPPGQIERALGGLDAIANSILARSGVPGLAIAVVQDGRTVYARGFGVKLLGEGAAIDAETVFPLASVSKPIGATVIAAQLGQGVMSWDTPVSRYLPDFTLSDARVGKEVTIGDLYAHRSGLPDHAGDDLEEIGFGRAEVLRRLRFLPLEPFRAGYAYTNFGLTAAAEAVAAASGRDWASLSEALIYKPLGMATASSRHADFMARLNKVTGHVRQSGRFTPAAPRQAEAQSPAGGVSASVQDMARWMAMVLDGGRLGSRSVVDADALLAALTPRSVSGPPMTADSRADFYGYGFGISVQPSGRVALSHSGAFEAGAATALLMLPSLRLGIVSLSNAIPVGAVEALNMEFADLAQYGERRRDWFDAYSAPMSAMMAPSGELAGQTRPATPTPHRPLETYAGQYGSDYAGPAFVRVAAGQLALSLGPADWRATLRHWDGGRFYFSPPLTDAPEGSISAVDFSADGTGMRVELLDGAGAGHFRRL